MLRLASLALLALPLALVAPNARAADEAKGEKVQSATYPDYFEKNNSGLKGDVSMAAFASKEAFEKVFALRPPLMGGKKSVPVPEGAFGKQAVFAVIHRGNAITKYTVEKVTAEGDTIYVQYKAVTDPPGTATFASPLIISADKGKAKKVAFIENGKNIGTTDLN